jgi:flagellar L-ring protein precursor FlgH
MKRPAYIASYVMAALIMSSCATTGPEMPPPSPPFAEAGKSDEQRSVNSLWSERGGLFDDLRARRVNDLVTIKISESASASKNAGTKTARDSNMISEISALLGLPLDLNKSNTYGKGNTFSPNVEAFANNDFSGSGKTTRAGTLAATITARVVEVQSNGNLVVESRKEITVNRETQTLVLRGVIRPYDIEGDNTIRSEFVADSRIRFMGDGVIGDKQGQGWLVRILDKIWPF